MINLSSVMAYLVLPNFVLYCSGKAFSYALTSVACSELRKNYHGTKVDLLSLHPGYVDTPLTSHNKVKLRSEQI